MKQLLEQSPLVVKSLKSGRMPTLNVQSKDDANIDAKGNVYAERGDRR